MSKERFEAARAYLKAGQYDDARRILKSIDHPKAKEWLAKIDQTPAMKARKRQRIALSALLIFLFVVFATFGYLAFTASREGAQTGRITARLNTYCADSASDRSTCRAWVDEMIETNYPTLQQCDQSAANVDDFRQCIRRQGIRP